MGNAASAGAQASGGPRMAEAVEAAAEAAGARGGGAGRASPSMWRKPLKSALSMKSPAASAAAADLDSVDTPGAAKGVAFTRLSSDDSASEAGSQRQPPELKHGAGSSRHGGIESASKHGAGSLRHGPGVAVPSRFGPGAGSSKHDGAPRPASNASRPTTAASGRTLSTQSSGGASRYRRNSDGEEEWDEDGDDDNGRSMTGTTAAPTEFGTQAPLKQHPGTWSGKVMAALHLLPGENGQQVRQPSVMLYTQRRPPQHKRTVASKWWVKVKTWAKGGGVNSNRWGGMSGKVSLAFSGRSWMFSGKFGGGGNASGATSMGPSAAAAAAAATTSTAGEDDMDGRLSRGPSASAGAALEAVAEPAPPPTAVAGTGSWAGGEAVGGAGAGGAARGATPSGVMEPGAVHAVSGRYVWLAGVGGGQEEAGSAGGVHQQHPQHHQHPQQHPQHHQHPHHQQTHQEHQQQLKDQLVQQRQLQLQHQAVAAFAAARQDGAGGGAPGGSRPGPGAASPRAPEPAPEWEDVSAHHGDGAAHHPVPVPVPIPLGPLSPGGAGASVRAGASGSNGSMAGHRTSTLGGNGELGRGPSQDGGGLLNSSLRSPLLRSGTAGGGASGNSMPQQPSPVGRWQSSESNPPLQQQEQQHQQTWLEPDTSPGWVHTPGSASPGLNSYASQQQQQQQQQLQQHHHQHQMHLEASGWEGAGPSISPQPGGGGSPFGGYAADAAREASGSHRSGGSRRGSRSAQVCPSPVIGVAQMRAQLLAGSGSRGSAHGNPSPGGAAPPVVVERDSTSSRLTTGAPAASPVVIEPPAPPAPRQYSSGADSHTELGRPSNTYDEQAGWAIEDDEDARMLNLPVPLRQPSMLPPLTQPRQLLLRNQFSVPTPAPQADVSVPHAPQQQVGAWPLQASPSIQARAQSPRHMQQQQLQLQLQLRGVGAAAPTPSRSESVPQNFQWPTRADVPGLMGHAPVRA